MSGEEFNQLKQMIHNNEYWGDRLANATHQALNQGMTESEQMFRLYDDLANTGTIGERMFRSLLFMVSLL